MAVDVESSPNTNVDMEK